MDPRFSGRDPLNVGARTASSSTPGIENADTTPSTAVPEKPGRPGVWAALLAGTVGSIVAQLIGLAIVAVTMELMGLRAGRASSGEPSVMAFMRTAPGAFAAVVASGLGLAVVAVAGGVGSDVPFARRLALVRPAISPPHLALAVLASIGVVVVSMLMLTGLAAIGGPVPSAWREELVSTFRNAPVGWGVALITAGGLMPGISEELLFRGFVQSRLLERWPPAVAIGASAVLFAIAHGDVAYALFALPAGVWLGYLAWRTGSVLPSMLCHAIVNASFQGLLVFGPDDAEHVPRALVAAGATVALLAMLAIVPAVRALESAHRARAAGRETAA